MYGTPFIHITSFSILFTEWRSPGSLNLGGNGSWMEGGVVTMSRNGVVRTKHIWWRIIWHQYVYIHIYMKHILYMNFMAINGNSMSSSRSGAFWSLLGVAFCIPRMPSPIVHQAVHGSYKLEYHAALSQPISDWARKNKIRNKAP